MPIGTRRDNYPNEESKLVDNKRRDTLMYIIKGTEDVDRLKRLVEAEVEYAQKDDRDPRKDVVAFANNRIEELSE